MLLWPLACGGVHLGFYPGRGGPFRGITSRGLMMSVGHVNRQRACSVLAVLLNRVARCKRRAYRVSVYTSSWLN